MKYVGVSESRIYQRNLEEAGSANGMLFRFAKMMYDPTFGDPSSPEDMTSVHLKYREDMLVKMSVSLKASDSREVVGIIA